MDTTTHDHGAMLSATTTHNHGQMATTTDPHAMHRTTTGHDHGGGNDGGMSHGMMVRLYSNKKTFYLFIYFLQLNIPILYRWLCMVAIKRLLYFPSGQPQT